MIILAVVLVCAIGITGIARAVRGGGSAVEVTQVSYLNNGWWGDSKTSGGYVTANASQEVYLDSDKIVEKVYVKEGDKVKIGDTLLEYDKTLLELDMEEQQLDKQIKELELKGAQSDLEKLKKITPIPDSEGGTSPGSSLLDDGDDIHHLTADALGQTDDDAGGIFAAGKEQLVERLLALGENSGIIQKIAGGRRTQSKAGKKREVRVERFVFLQQIGDGITAKLRVAADDAVDTAAQADDRIHNKHPFYDGLRRLFLTASNAPKGSGRHKKTPSRSGWSCKAERAAQAAASLSNRPNKALPLPESSAPSAPFCIRSCRA